MNLDKLVKNVVQAGEANQFFDIVDGAAGHGFHQAGGLQREGSVTMPRGLSNRTVDEVWRVIQVEEQTTGSGDLGGGGRHERRPTLGEITLEDFLAKAGVVAGGLKDRSRSNATSNVDFTQGVHWLQEYQQQAQESVLGSYVGRPVPHPLGAGAGAILDAVYQEGQGANVSPAGVRPMSDPQTAGRKRSESEGMAEKTVERRQKRMIKNRESAARSRARKQAYTNELENKVSRLEEENERLRKEKELETVIHFVPRPEPKNQLRRTSSGPF